MARPKSDDPRTKRLMVRCTPAEEAQVKAAAQAAGLSQTDYVRGRVFDVRPTAGLLERTELPRSDPSTSSEAAKPEPAPVDWMPSAHDRTAWWCPESLCNRRSHVKGERCPVHGTAMTQKSRGA